MENKNRWIVEGYQIFAHHGLGSIKVEPLAKLVGKSKTSFYHYFADMDVFMQYLLDYHLKQSQIIALKN